MGWRIGERPAARLRWSAALGFLALLASCAAALSDGSRALSLRILSYNVQNLFDDDRAGNEYPEFLPALPAEGAGESGAPARAWNRAAYRERLGRLARVIKEAAGLPDIVVLYEVESRKVVEDLRQDFLPVGAYPQLYLQDDPRANIHIAVLSRRPLAAMRSHRYAVDGDSARPVWELHFALPPGGLVLFANHWKSKSGGEEATEAARVLAARVLAAAVAGLRTTGALLVACGDFNEIPGPARPKSKAVPACLSASPGRTQGGRPFRMLAGWAGGQALVRQAGGLVSLADTGQDWISPWRAGEAAYDQDDQGQSGSYWYDGRWEPIDHFLVRQSENSAAAWKISGFRVLAPAWLVDSAGLPQRYDSRSGKGYSDHLPLLLELTQKQAKK